MLSPCADSDVFFARRKESYGSRTLCGGRNPCQAWVKSAIPPVKSERCSGEILASPCPARVAVLNRRCKTMQKPRFDRGNLLCTTHYAVYKARSAPSDITAWQCISSRLQIVYIIGPSGPHIITACRAYHRPLAERISLLHQPEYHSALGQNITCSHIEQISLCLPEPTHHLQARLCAILL